MADQTFRHEVLREIPVARLVERAERDSHAHLLALLCAFRARAGLHRGVRELASRWTSRWVAG